MIFVKSVLTLEEIRMEINIDLSSKKNGRGSYIGPMAGSVTIKLDSFHIESGVVIINDSAVVFGTGRPLLIGAGCIL